MRYRCLVLIVALLAVSTHCRAGFVNGTDAFRGIGLDSTTWATDGGNGGGYYLQNDGLMINASGSALPAPFADYYTWDAVVPVGGSVWAPVQIRGIYPGDVGYATVGLVDNPTGRFSASPPDSIHLETEALYSSTGGSINGGYSQITGNLEMTSGWRLSATPPALWSTMVYQIERLTSSQTRFSVFSEGTITADGRIPINLVSYVTVNTPAQADNMHAWLECYGSVAEFDRVTINSPLALGAKILPALPEPVVLPAVVVTVCLFRRRRQRASSSTAVAP